MAGRPQGYGTAVHYRGPRHPRACPFQPPELSITIGRGRCSMSSKIDRTKVTENAERPWSRPADWARPPRSMRSSSMDDPGHPHPNIIADLSFTWAGRSGRSRSSAATWPLWKNRAPIPGFGLCKRIIKLVPQDIETLIKAGRFVQRPGIHGRRPRSNTDWPPNRAARSVTPSPWARCTKK